MKGISLLEMKQNTEIAIEHFVKRAKEEYVDTKDAMKIVSKYIVEKQITREEEFALREQLFDTLKIIGIVVPFILIPGASIVMPIIIKVAKKHKIDLLPSEKISKKEIV